MLRLTGFILILTELGQEMVDNLNEKKIAVAKGFVDKHRYLLPAWTPKFQNPNMSYDDAYLAIYNAMLAGNYGKVRRYYSTTDYWGITCEIEVDCYNSDNGSPVLYEWDSLEMEVA